jgi:hypothetical protein
MGPTNEQQLSCPFLRALSHIIKYVTPQHDNAKLRMGVGPTRQSPFIIIPQARPRKLSRIILAWVCCDEKLSTPL